MSERFASTMLVAALLAACGSGDAEREPGPPERVSIQRGADTVVVVLLDSIPASRLAPYGYEHDTTPHLARLAGEGVVFEDCLAACTGTNAAVAALFTGLHPHEHGVGSLKHLGQHRLADRHETLAERLRTAGYRTLAAVSLPQLRGPLSGLGQGFEVFLQPELSEEARRDAQQTFWSARPELERLLASEERVFCVIHFSDAREGGSAPAEVRARFLDAHLAPFGERNATIALHLARVPDDPAGAIAALEAALGRGRGSPEHAAFLSALYDGRVAHLDHHLGLLLELLEEHGRYDDALIALVGTRGSFPSVRDLGTRPAFAPELVRVPLVVRFPGGRPVARVAEVTSAVDVAPTVVEALGVGAGAGVSGRSLLARLEGGAADPRPALCTDASLGRHAAFGPALQVEEHSVVETAVFTRQGEWVQPAGLAGAGASEIESLRAVLDASARPRPGWRVELAGGAARALDVRWRFARGYERASRIETGQGKIFETGSARSKGLGGHALLAATGAVLVVDGSERGLPLRLELRFDGGALDERDILFGDGVALSDTLVPRLASDEEVPWPLEEDGRERLWSADLSHAGGTWWRLEVAGEAGRSVEALVALYPAERVDEELRWTGRGVRGERLPGRFDTLRFEGETPFAVEIEKTPQRRIALAIRVDGSVLPAGELRYRGRCFAPEGQLVLYLPDWMAGITDPLDRPRVAELASGAVVVTRRGPEVAPEDRAGLDSDQLTFVRRLGASE